MKYLLSVILAVTIGCSTMAAGALSPIFNEFKSEKNCTIIKIPRTLMWIIKKSSDEPIVKKINSMKVMAIEQCDNTIANRISNRAKELSTELEQLARVTDDNQNVTIWMNKKKDKIKNIYIFVNDDDKDLVLVEFNGNFTIDDITQLIDQANNKKKKIR